MLYDINWASDTTAVDPESDKEIQAVIRREFASCTMCVDRLPVAVDAS